MKNMKTHVVRTISIILAVLLVAFIAISNTAPLGAGTSYNFEDKALGVLGPKDRVKFDDKIAIQKSDLVYFSSSMPFSFDLATVKLKIRNPSFEQIVDLGFRDKDEWHYSRTRLADPKLDSLTWPQIGTGPYLYQKIPSFIDSESFIQKPPKDKLIGTYDYDSSALEQHTTLPNYMQNDRNTIITTPLRGQVTMYVYMNGEPFSMSLIKRDLNWYNDPDVLTAKVFQGTDQVFEATIDDDGNDSSDRRLGVAQKVTMRNPGPEDPPAGVYKVVIDAPGDTVITRIETNLHKIAFEGPLYVAANREVYGNIVPSTIPTTLVTNALGLTLNMEHKQPQTVSIGDKSAKLAMPHQPVSLKTDTALTAITIPKSDVIINGVGYFSFSQEHFFTPTPYHIIPIKSAADLERVDYVLTNYVTPKKLADGWIEVERTFDLSTAVIKDGKLSWVISAPGLAENGRTIEIKDIEMTLTKKGWWK